MLELLIIGVLVFITGGFVLGYYLLDEQPLSKKDDLYD